MGEISSPFRLMWNLRRSMDFPALPLEESLKHSEGMQVLLNACIYLLGEKQCESPYRDNPETACH